MSDPIPQSPQPVYQYAMRLNPQTNRYEYVAIDPTTGQAVTAEQFDANRSTRYSTRRMLDEIYNTPTKTCPEGYQYDAETDTCKKIVADTTLPDTTSTVSPDTGGDDGGDSAGLGSSGGRPAAGQYSETSTYGYVPRGVQTAAGLLGGPLVGGAIAYQNQQAIADAQGIAGIPVQPGLGGIVDRVRTDPYDSIGTVDINDNTYSVNFGGGLTDEGRTGLTPLEAAKRQRDIDAWNAREDKPSAFTTPTPEPASGLGSSGEGMGPSWSGPQTSISQVAQNNQVSYEEAAGLAAPTPSSPSRDSGDSGPSYNDNGNETNYSPDVNDRGNISDDFDQDAQDRAFEEARQEAEQRASDNDSGGSDDDGCVVATEMVRQERWSSEDKARAVVWCKKYLHGNFLGEAFRRGYRHVGSRAVSKMKHSDKETLKYGNTFQSFVDCVTGKDVSAKNVALVAYYAVYLTTLGLFLKK